MTVLFFAWGFMTVFNDVLIPRFKTAFALDYFRAMLVQFAFFGAYFVGSLIYFLISAASGDPIARLGYKNGIVLGLLIAATGTGLFWPAANLLSYPLFLGALFIVGLGFALLQIAANPYVTILGPERTASSRLNLAQAFNSLGTTTGPVIGGYLIFQYFAASGAHGAESVKVPYLVATLVFLVLAATFFCIRLPQVGEGRLEPGLAALRRPHVVLGIGAIFMYVGGEVSVGSSIISYLGQPSVAGLSEIEASHYVSLFWGGMLIGRFMGAIELSELAPATKQVALAAVPLAAFVALGLLRSWSEMLLYAPFLALCWLGFLIGGGNAGRTLMLFSLVVATLLAIAIGIGGKVAMWCIIGAGLFTSIGWSNTFALAIDGLGVYKSQASSLLVMAIVGGALLPPLQGWLADHSSLQHSFIVPLCAYAYVAFYGAFGHRVGRGREASS
ncbi:MAG: sugar MFS transporter [Verrucomicrobia bacterium]|nr:sugar MFS transporter [Verrucomicrobiota bacterium]